MWGGMAPLAPPGCAYGCNSLVRSTMGAPNQCKERPIAAGAPITPNNVTSTTSFPVEHMLPKDLSFEYGGPELASCPGRHPTLSRPCTAHVTIKKWKSIFLLMKFVQHPVLIKKEIISFTVIAPGEFHPPVVKNVVLTLFQWRFS